MTNIIQYSMKTVLLIFCFFGSISGEYNLRGVPESYAVLGENYRLQCDVTDSPGFVDFRRDDINKCTILSPTCESSLTDDRYKCGCINNDNKQLYLNISNIDKQDDTTWYCRGNSGVQGSIDIPVYYGPENTRLNTTGDNIDVIEGNSQSVNCLADCKPDCNINWSKDGSTTTLNNPLSFSTRDQNGSYTCTVKHTVSNKQQTKQLNVQIYYGPDELTFLQDITSINITEGRNQTIECSSDCYQCNYKWSGNVSSSTKDLVLTQIKRNQEGEYICEATNIINTNPKTRSKSLQVNVQYPPDITSITSKAVDNETDKGSDVIFNCNVDSKPVSTITWSSSTNTDTNTGQQWTLTQAKCQDTGIYTCTANNGIGQPTSKSLPLNIRCSPRINGELKDKIKNRLGEVVTLSINVIAYPKPSFKWIQESTGEELTSDSVREVAINKYISSLTLTIQQSSFGYYTVTVTNGISDKSYTIQIIDGDPPVTPGPSTELNIAAVVGGIVAAIVAITIVIVVVIVIRRRKKGPDSPTTSPKNQHVETIPNDLYEGSDDIVQRRPQGHDNPAVEILENDLYEGSDHIFGKSPDVVPKADGNGEGGIFGPASKMAPNAEPVYGQVNKPKKDKANKKREPKKPPKPDKAPPVPQKIGEGNNNDGVYQNTGAVGKQSKKNAEGLNYSDVVFSNKEPTNKVHGKKEEVVYVEIDPKKKGKPLTKEELEDSD